MSVVIAGVVAGFFAAAAQAVSPAEVEKETKTVITKRLAFIGDSSLRFRSARCQSEGQGHFFCVVRVSSYGQVLAPMYYTVKIDASGYMRWTLQK